MLNKNEARILEVIGRDPFITQQNIANELGLTRSTVATIISGLTQKKHLLGRAYVVNRASGIYCIGAMNVDRTFNLLDDVVDGTSNPAVSTLNAGGVARNIAEKLGRLDLNVSLVSLGGNDQDYQYIKHETEPYVNMQHATQLSGFSTGTYNAILNHQGDLTLAVADMQINDEMTVEWLMNYQSILQEARLLVIDLNLPLETLAYTLKLARQFEIETFVIPVSAPKMNRLPKELAGVTWLIASQEESEAYFDMKVETEEDFEGLVDRWMITGVENIMITRETASGIYANQDGERVTLPTLKRNFMVDETGTNNSFSIDVIYSVAQGKTGIEAVEQGLKKVNLTVEA